MHANVVVNLPGDYDGNGVVDATDFSVLKSLFGSMENLAADGNGGHETIWSVDSLPSVDDSRYVSGTRDETEPTKTAPTPKANGQRRDELPAQTSVRRIQKTNRDHATAAFELNPAKVWSGNDDWLAELRSSWLLTF